MSFWGHSLSIISDFETGYGELFGWEMEHAYVFRHVGRD